MPGLLSDFLQGASNAAASTVTGPIDLLAMLMQKAGIPVPSNAVGSTQWAQQRGLIRQPQNRAAGLLGETAGLISPVVVSAKAPQIARGLLQAGENAAKPSSLRNIGQRGIFGGELAQTADKAALAKAKQLEASGKDAQAIWSETGWFKGGDGKWRFEIDDSASAIRTNNVSDPAMFADVLDEAATRQSGVPMGNALRHDELFSAYPQSRALRFTVGGPEGGSFSGNTVRVADPYSVKGGQDTRSVALHELQHAIQRREGFAEGGNPGWFPDAETLNNAQLLAARIRRGDTPSQAASWIKQKLGKSPSPSSFDLAMGDKSLLAKLGGSPETAYRNLAGEAEARAVQARMNMTPAQRRATFPLDSYDVPVDQLIYWGAQ